MIYNTRKYLSVKDFIISSKNFSTISYSLPMQTCMGIQSNYTINDECFYCNFCAFDKLREKYYEKLKDIIFNYNFNNFFNESPIKLSNSKFYINNLNNKNIETFTSIEETKRIQLWCTAILSHCTKNKCISAIEIPAFNESFDRDGRIDIGIKENNKYLFIETKTTLKEAMMDERFVEQHSKYTTSITECLNPLTDTYCLCIIIGGKETDLYPKNNIHCTGYNIGNTCDRFYELISNNDTKIPFISARAIWALSLYYLYNNDFSINEFLLNMFEEENCYGLVSAGKIVYNNESQKFEIKSFKL